MSDSRMSNPLFPFARRQKKKSKGPFIHILLFAITFVTCVIAGTQWAFKDPFEVSNWHHGLTYAILILTFLSAHEFGHYFASKFHGVDATLPYYIPFPLPIFINFGTFGAVIKTKSPIPDRKALFDIGIAGPLAGFAVCVVFLIYGFSTLPGKEYILQLHPEYITQFGGEIPEKGLYFGDTLFYWIMAAIFKNPEGFIPPMNEVYHYPFLNVGWFGLFVTALNLLPMGQLDGGHIMYAMFGRWHTVISRAVWWFLLLIGLGSVMGLLHEFFIPNYDNTLLSSIRSILYPPLDWIADKYPGVYRGWFGWLFWAFIAKVFIKLQHPYVPEGDELGTGRKILGWIAIAILFMSFSFNGIYFIEPFM
ncbi:MAG: site-2 protease family protein [Candidatus Kapaibacterium sp.]